MRPSGPAGAAGQVVVVAAGLATGARPLVRLGRLFIPAHGLACHAGVQPCRRALRIRLDRLPAAVVRLLVPARLVQGPCGYGKDGRVARYVFPGRPERPQGAIVPVVKRERKAAVCERERVAGGGARELFKVVCRLCRLAHPHVEPPAPHVCKPPLLLAEHAAGSLEGVLAGLEGLAVPAECLERCGPLRMGRPRAGAPRRQWPRRTPRRPRRAAPCRQGPRPLRRPFPCPWDCCPRQMCLLHRPPLPPRSPLPPPALCCGYS